MLVLLFLDNWFYFLVPAVIAQILILTAELVIPTGIQNHQANAEIETQPVIVEIKGASAQHNLNT